MDIIDVANDRADRDLSIALAQAMRHEPPLPAVGQCYNCLDSLPDGVRFCDCDCRNDYTNRKRMESMRG